MNSDESNKQLRQKAEKLLAQKGIEKNNKFYNDIESLVEELSIHQIELEMQNRELQEANKNILYEQNRYKELFLNAPIAYFTLNSTGNIIELNYAAADLLQKPIYSFKFTSIFPYLHEKSKTEFSRYFKTAFSSQETEYGEITFVNSQGKEVYATLSAVSYFDEKAKEKFVRCTITDISKTKLLEKEIETQQKLRESENRMQNLFSENGVPMLIIDPETGKIDDANPAASDFYGYSIDELKNKYIAEINQLTEAEVKAEMDNTRRLGKKYFNFKHRLANGRIADVAVYSSAISYGKTVKLFSIIHDISDSKKNKEINERLNNELKKANKKLFLINEELNTSNEELNTANEELLTKNDELKEVNNKITVERKQFLSILDSIPEIIYVSDFETSEILFANKKLKKIIGRDITGEKCFNAIQGKKKSCDFCTNKIIQQKDEAHFWEFHN